MKLSDWTPNRDAAENKCLYFLPEKAVKIKIIYYLAFQSSGFKLKIWQQRMLSILTGSLRSTLSSVSFRSCPLNSDPSPTSPRFWRENTLRDVPGDRAQETQVSLALQLPRFGDGLSVRLDTPVSGAVYCFNRPTIPTLTDLSSRPGSRLQIYSF